PADLRQRFPQLASYEALRVPAVDVGAILSGQVAVAAFDGAGRLADATGVQIAGVLDDLYGGARTADLGPSWQHGRPTLAVWAPTAKNVTLLLGEQRVGMRRDEAGVWRVTGPPTWRDARYAYEVAVYVPSADAVIANVVTDPYSLGLTTNATRSIVVN